ncbi:MAG: MBL fold metallo-hydrolase [Methanothrix sp.]|jgi:glyoxylase-like metal-dependent hydrolase (beta-lactamase superfamily II)|uniref:MBL fold metallo-hydrolase n=1 Tax=Methanothrix sp. TaxID=90426 RepID=UPI00247C78BC|nr:MBL fold metallo-hydrolase [Methanothrix sp.]
MSRDVIPMKIVLVKPGSLKRDEAGNILYASSSVTLIISDRILVVDTGSADERGLVFDGLRRAGASPDDIEIVVNTHLHEDHTGCNDMFCNADVLSYHTGLREGCVLAQGVRVMETPGHTLDSISVLCRGDTVIAGDALPTADNHIKDLPPRIHVDRALALRSMHRIAGIARIVVPGHGMPFSIPDGRDAELR